MSHYIVRVYRRETENNQHDRLYGVLEAVESGEKSVFRSFGEFWTILSSAESVRHDFKSEKRWEDQQEKRRDIRFSYRCSMEYRIRDGSVDSPTNGAASGKLIDVSRSGIRMRTQTNGQSLKKGMVLQVWIPMADPPVAFPSVAQVGWVRQGQSGDCQVGLQFVR